MTSADLDFRVDAIEVAQSETTETLKWTVAKLGRIAAVQDEQTLRLERIDARLDRIEKKFDDFAANLPSIIADTMRDVLKERG